ncbi:DoxX family membrane protein [Cohnella fermenti]|uniref:DoxX family membrane protein n=2 Tax=Cohnella fermenti TaxID=2565925 RepID=A0A4S4BSQ3_9BACL|nr:DoxX family membrane protein [Cohnella fermenti]
MNWLRTNKIAAGLMVLIRFYLGWKWLDAGWHKLTSADGFHAAGFLGNAVKNPVLETGTQDALYPNYLYFLKHFAVPNSGIFDHVIPWGEFLVGLGLILGALTTAAAFFGMVMNFMFLLAGTVSSNPWLILFGIVVMAVGANAGRFGVDYYLLPYLKKAIAAVFHHKKGQTPQTPQTPVGPQGVAG